MARIAFLFYLLVQLSVLFCLPTTSTALIKIDNRTDRSALLALKSYMRDPSDLLRKGWSTTIPVCKWIRVMCSSRHQRVVNLNLSYIGLEGPIAPEIGNLSFLRVIDLRGNNFQGSLPPEMMNLRRLRYINLMYNNFSGEVPPWLGSLPNLVEIRFSNNGFTGVIPLSLFNSSKLEYLSIPFNGLQGNYIPQEIGTNANLKFINMSGNQLTGPIPQSLWNLTSLESFDFTANSLSGDLPLNICSDLPKLQKIYLSENKLFGQIQSRFDNCSQLQIVSMASNNFSGPIPRGLGNLTVLNILSLGRNNFSGEIPPEIGNLLNLEILAIEENDLAGQVPEEIGNLQKLNSLRLSSNSLSGLIPSSIFNISSLESFWLTENNISGSLPPNIGNQLPNLQSLGLGMNRLSGVISDSISNLTKLALLELGDNELTGSVPASLGSLAFLDYFNLANNHLNSGSGSTPELSFLLSLMNCRKLRHFSMSGNPIRGTLPSAMANFSNSLVKFDASFCEIEGNIPHEIGNMSGMLDLNLGGNSKLSGPLPMSLQRLLNLQSLDLHGNRISGSIPNYFCDLRYLSILQLGENQLMGQVPECFGNLTSLRNLFLYSNKLNSTLPESLLRLKDLLYLDVHSNSLSGKISTEIGNMKAVLLVELSENEFSGDIPSTIGDLENLINLSLAHNRLQGPIPETLSRMLSLESLDLSSNYFNGEIPLSLKALMQLKYFNVSFNGFRGEIPTAGPFMNFTVDSFKSNNALCGGPPHLQFPPCRSGAPNSFHCPSNCTPRWLFLAVVACILIPILFVVIIIVIVAYWRPWLAYCISFINSQRINSSSPSHTDVFPLASDKRISYDELQYATNGFNQSNLIAPGSFGSIYNGVLWDGTMVAIKVFDLKLERAFKSFKIEYEVLLNTRHRNLIKVISCCSNYDFKALVLQYMPNGSLEKWLHSQYFPLDFLQRLDIMIDVASALDYLHHGYSSTVVHCDLKPSNILLDENMTAHVCDFGMAKLFNGSDSMAYTQTISTVGYIAPEYGSHGKVSTSCDIYSFGILLMETFSGKKPTDEMFSENWGLKEWVKDLLQTPPTYFIEQKRIMAQRGSWKKMGQCMSDIMELALKCTVESLKERIDIKCALEKLKKIKVHFLSKHISSRYHRVPNRLR